MVPSGRIHNVLEFIAPNDVLLETEEKAAGLSADMMNSSVESAPRTMPARRRRWQTLCRVLATCSLLAIGLGFDISRQFMAFYTESVRLNREWSNRLGSYSELGQLAAAINAPCSDVFDTHDDAVESAKLDKAVAQFGEKMRELREETSSRVPPIESRAIFQQMDAVQATVDLITGDARLIFACFRDDQPDEAGRHLARTARKFAQLNSALVRLQSCVRDIQRDELEVQLARAASMRAIETALGLALMVLLIGIAFYGSRLYRTAAPFPPSEETLQGEEALMTGEEPRLSTVESSQYALVDATLRDQTERRKAKTEREEQARLFAFRADVDHALSHNQSIPAMLHGCAVAMQKHLDAALARIWMFDLKRAQLELQASAGLDTRLDGAHSRIPVGRTVRALSTPLNPTQRRQLETVNPSADALLRLIDDIINFSKIEAGKLELETVEFSLRQELAKTIKALAVKAREKGLELLLHIPPSMPDSWRGDTRRLQQVIINLVGNAIKFTETGEIAVRVRLEPDEAAPNGCSPQPASAPPAQFLYFSVTDTGIGIAPNKVGRIFHEFTQADATITRKYGGTGLGLSISRRLVELMGGSIWVESQEEKGATFHFIVKFQPGSATKPPSSPPESLRGWRVS